MQAQGGLQYLRPRGLDLPFYQLYLLDILFLAFLVLAAVFLVITFLLKAIMKCLLGSSKKEKTNWGKLPPGFHAANFFSRFSVASRTTKRKMDYSSNKLRTNVDFFVLVSITIGNNMNVNAITDLPYNWHLKNLFTVKLIILINLPPFSRIKFLSRMMINMTFGLWYWGLWDTCDIQWKISFLSIWK